MLGFFMGLAPADTASLGIFAFGKDQSPTHEAYPDMTRSRSGDGGVTGSMGTGKRLVPRGL